MTAAAAHPGADVRPARASDAPAAAALYAALHAEHEALDARYRRAGDAVRRWATDVRDWARSPRSRVLLAWRGEAAVGLLTAHLYEPAPTFEPHLLVWVDDLYVAPDARGQGVGRALLSDAVAWGQALGAVEVRAGVLAANADGRAFWATVGAADFSVTVAAPLPLGGAQTGHPTAR